MAANMMEILKQMNRNINIIETKVSEIDKKMDQQQKTINNLEQQVKKNNTLLFGNDEAGINFQSNSTVESNLVSKNNKTYLVDESEENVGNTEIMLLKNPSTNSLNRMCQKEAYCECDNKINDDKNTEHIVLESITNELREIKDFLIDFEATIKTMSSDKKVDQMSPAHYNADQINKLTEELKRYRDEIKDYITHSAATKKIIGKAVSTDKKEVEKKEEIVQISPTYFSADQISKLNTELKRIAQTYRSTNTFPIIEVLPGGQEHPVMIQLRKGVRYNTVYYGYNAITLKLGVDGYKRSEIQEMLEEYPDLTLTDVVTALLKSRKWTLDQLRSYYNMLKNPLPYAP